MAKPLSNPFKKGIIFSIEKGETKFI